MFILIDGHQVTADEIKAMFEQDRLATVTSGKSVSLMFLHAPFDPSYELFLYIKCLDIKRPLDLSAALFAASF